MGGKSGQLKREVIAIHLEQKSSGWKLEEEIGATDVHDRELKSLPWKK